MLICLIRTVSLYFLLIAVIRLMGKRQLGEMGPLEFVVAILIADLASVPMQDLAIPLLSGIIPILTILAAELLLSVLCYRFPMWRRLFSGKPVILMENGTLLQKNLSKTRITPDELTFGRTNLLRPSEDFVTFLRRELSLCDKILQDCNDQAVLQRRRETARVLNMIQEEKL